MSSNTQLPADLAAEVNQFIKDKIEIEREYWNNNPSADSDRAKTYVAGYGKGISAGATEYAISLHQVEQENAQLKQWKSEAAELLNPILEYGQSKEAGIPLGKSITNTVLERCKKAAALQAKCDRHEDALMRICSSCSSPIGVAQHLSVRIAKQALSGEDEKKGAAKKTEEILDHLGIVQNQESKKYHGAYYRNKPTPSGCVRFILQCTTADGFNTPEEAAAAIEKAFPKMQKITK